MHNSEVLRQLIPRGKLSRVERVVWIYAAVDDRATVAQPPATIDVPTQQEVLARTARCLERNNCARC